MPFCELSENLFLHKMYYKLYSSSNMVEKLRPDVLNYPQYSTTFKSRPIFFFKNEKRQSGAAEPRG